MTGIQRRGAADPVRALAVLLMVLLMSAASAVTAEPIGASHTIDVTAKITYVKVLDDGLDGTGRGDADIYAGFAIGSSTFRDCGTFASHPHGETELRPDDWTCSTAITPQSDSQPGFTNVDLQVWDHDDCDRAFCNDTGELESDDDQADVSPGSNYTLSLSVSLATGRWTSAGGTTDADWPRNCAEGSGDDAVKICWDISIDSTSGDADEDGLLDGWERNGYNADGDATIDLDLPTIGTSPFKKDLLLELDCLVAAGNHTHCPAQAAVQDVVQGFANAPIINRDGSWGVQLHVDVGNIYGDAFNVATAVARTEVPVNNGAVGHLGNYGSTTSIPEAGNTIVDFDGAAGNPGVNIATIRAANMDSRRFLVMRYGLFGHNTNARQAVNDCTSGLALGDMFMVTLGGVRNPVPPATNPTRCWGADAGGQSVGSRAQQAGTLMHEFGHVLGLDHGGGDGDNAKPNYLSVMNYSFQQCSVPATAGVGLPGGCDFSRIDLDDLVETSLDECKGLGNGLPAVNWNGDGNFSGPFLDGATCSPSSPNVTFNVNDDTTADMNGNDSQDGTEPDRLTTLAGYDDWDNLQYRLNANGGGAGGTGTADATPEMIEHAEALVAELFRATPAIDKTGPSDAQPGDTLSYTLNATNTAANGVWANGPAMAAALADTRPDGSSVTFDLGTIPAGGSASRSTSFDVACDTGDGTVLTNSVTLTAQDFLNTPLSASDSISTTIHAPVLTLGKTATTAVNAGEAISYTVTYANAGTGDATNVVISDTLPADVYYSLALDGGIGPKPNSVVENGDGTTTLTWTIGTVSGSSGPQSISYTARPTLLFIGGETLTNSATLAFENANGCSYDADEATASTTITVVPATRDPLSMGFWRNHGELWSAEFLARIQATDQRFDGADGSTPDGILSPAEVTAVMAPSGNGIRVLQQQFTGTLLNLASRRINAATVIDSKLTLKLGLRNVRDAARYAQGTLDLPLTKATQGRYSDATTILDGVNNNRIEKY